MAEPPAAQEQTGSATRGEQSLQEWFDELCKELWPKWEARITKALAKDNSKPRADIEAFIAQRAAQELNRLDAEMVTMLSRSGVIVAATTLLFALYAFVFDLDQLIVAGLFLLALIITAVSFGYSLMAMAPPLKRAWRDPYEKRADWTLLATDEFEAWALDCWSADRRTPFITGYKKAHSVAIRLLIVATGFAVIGLAVRMILEAVFG